MVDDSLKTYVFHVAFFIPNRFLRYIVALHLSLFEFNATTFMQRIYLFNFLKQHHKTLQELHKLHTNSTKGRIPTKWTKNGLNTESMIFMNFKSFSIFFPEDYKN